MIPAAEPAAAAEPVSPKGGVHAALPVPAPAPSASAQYNGNGETHIVRLKHVRCARVATERS